MAGDCAETFDDFSITNIRDTYRIILQMGVILSFGTGVPTLKVGRIAGQFAKPRSEEYEIINNRKIPVYRGDIINSKDNNELSRLPNPERMLTAYFQSLQTLNILRAFTFGGYADISRIHAWNLDFVKQTEIGSKYRKTI
jgi:3-deoxy-7-phosphoheptulonate synthase